MDQIKKIKEISKRLKEPSFVLAWRTKIFKQLNETSKEIFKYGLGISVSIPDKFIENFGKDQTEPLYDFKTWGNAKIMPLNEALLDKDITLSLKNIFSLDFPINNNFYFGMMASSFKNVLIISSGSGQDNKVELSSEFKGNYFDLVLVVVKKGAWLSVVDKMKSFAGAGPHHCGRSVIVLLDDGSKLFYINNSNLSEEAYSFSNKIAEVGKRAEVTWLDINKNALFIKSDIVNNLRGKESKAFCLNLSKSSNNQIFDFYNTAHHFADSTESYLGAVGEASVKSKIIYRGIIKIPKSLKDISGIQDGKFIMGSYDAEIDAVPALEIESRDVKTSHAVSVSYLGDDELFLPTSRGINKKEAREMVFEGYIEQSLSKIRNVFTEKIINKYKSMFDQ